MDAAMDPEEFVPGKDEATEEEKRMLNEGGAQHRELQVLRQLLEL